MGKVKVFCFVAAALTAAALVCGCVEPGVPVGSSIGFRIRSAKALDTRGCAASMPVDTFRMSDDMSLAVSVADWAGKDVTRGSIVTQDALNAGEAYEKLGLESLLRQKVEGQPIRYIREGKLTCDGAGHWSSENEYKWINEVEMCFWSYAPDTLFTSMDFSDDEAQIGGPCEMSFTYDTYSQLDLIVAHREQVNTQGTTVDLDFRHALSAIRFNTDGITNATVESIRFIGIKRGGECNVVPDESDELSFVWTPGPELGTFEEEGDEATFLLMPQQLPEDAELEVTFIGGDGITTVRSAVIGVGRSGGSISWLPGKIYTYTLTYDHKNSTWEFNVTTPDQVDYAGGTTGFTVTSKRLAGSQSFDVDWTAEYSEDGTNWSTTIPQWLADAPLAGSGVQSFTFDIPAREGETDAGAEMRVLDPVSGYNLANHTGASTDEETANCYVVSRPGTYSLPLVYGNAITGGTTNQFSYKASEGSEIALAALVNNRGDAITTPYIYDMAGCTPASCVLVWQDAPGLVTSVALSSDKHHLEFEVPAATIRQGNAVVAVRDKDENILWSWHIWVFDKDLSDVVDMESGDNAASFMRWSLGLQEAYQVHYQSRSCQIRFTQADSGNTATVTVEQQEYDDIYGDNCTFYQWGRKDPILSGRGISVVSKPCYTEDDRYAVGYSDMGNSLKDYISHPNLVNMYDDMDARYINLWNITASAYKQYDLAVVKTVYDPCPPGFRMPNTMEFESISQDAGSWNGAGWTVGELELPALGYRSYMGNYVYGVGTAGNFWSAVANDQHTGSLMAVDSGSINHYNFYNRALCLPVLPVKD